MTARIAQLEAALLSEAQGARNEARMDAIVTELQATMVAYRTMTGKRNVRR